MQIEKDHDKEVYDGDLGIVARIDLEASELVATFDGARWPTASAKSLDAEEIACAATVAALTLSQTDTDFTAAGIRAPPTSQVAKLRRSQKLSGR